VPERELENKYREYLKLLLNSEGEANIGDYLEFGVYTGTAIGCMNRALDALGLGDVRLLGFDSFEGLPKSARDDDEGDWTPGTYRSSEKVTRWYLEHSGVDMSRVTLIPGWFDESLTPELARELNLSRACVIMIDCDTYLSTKPALNFCHPLIGRRAVILFDDWHSGKLAERGLGEKRAFDEFLAEHPEFRATPIGTYTSNAEVFLVTRKGPGAEARADSADASSPLG